MEEQYVSDAEYETYYEHLNNSRDKIAGDLPVKPGARILDFATGYGYFALAVARREKTASITGIDIATSCVGKAKTNVLRDGFQNRITIVRGDVTRMPFADSIFDMAVNFVGLEDVHMTRGIAGVQRSIREVYRIIKPGASFCFVVMPPEVMETDAQKIEVELFSHICNATWLNGRQYEQMVNDTGLQLLGKKPYYTGKKLTPKQAEVEIRFACEHAPKIYRVKAVPFREVWAKYGKKIERHGLGHISKAIMYLTRKP